MKKTSVYLDEVECERLKAVAEEEQRTVAEVIRAAIAAYRRTPRTLALDGQFELRGKPVSQMTHEELEEMKRGFGEWRSS